MGSMVRGSQQTKQKKQQKEKENETIFRHVEIFYICGCFYDIIDIKNLTYASITQHFRVWRDQFDNGETQTF